MKNIPAIIINYKNTKLTFLNCFSNRKRIILPLLLVLGYILFYFFIDFSTQSLVAHDEGLYARRSRLVEESYNWFINPFNTPHHKTIGSYWFIALAIKLFGNSEFALRLPSILASFLCLVISYLIALKITNKKAALISIFSLSSMPLWIQYSRYASPDFPFLLCILLVIIFFLHYLESDLNIRKISYIFLSGLFISTAFFIRSYMVFVPLIGLSPFFLYHLYKSKRLFNIIFIFGILIGSIPTLINLSFSYKSHGIEGVILLFDFAKDKAIGGFNVSNFLLIPLNYLYLTFPVGILFVILFVFCRTNNKINYPLLIYIYPLLSLLTLLCMSTSYLHYYLFLLPPLSILFSVRLQSYFFTSSNSKKSIRYILLFFVLLISLSIIFLLLLYIDSFIQYSSDKIFLLYLVSSFLVLSFIASLRFLFEHRKFRFDLLKFFYNIIIPQYISISLLYNFGIIGNPNFRLKSFLREENVSSIINSNTIYLYNVDSKTNTLLSYYLPSSINVGNSEDIFMYNYIITSDIDFVKKIEAKSLYERIKQFDNHFLLMKRSK